MLYNKEQIGSLDKRITFQEKVIGENVSNEDEETGWQNIADYPTVWAKVNDRTGNEAHYADKLTGYMISDFVIRFKAGIGLENRIIYAGMKWNILSILPGSRKGYLKITAESGGEYQES